MGRPTAMRRTQQQPEPDSAEDQPVPAPWSEADVVAYIIDYTRIGASGTAIAKTLNNDGQRTPQGHRWTKAKVEATAAAHEDSPDGLATPPDAPPLRPNLMAELMCEVDSSTGDDPYARPPLTAVQSRAIRRWNGTM